MNGKCVCGCGREATDDAHFPVHRGMGGRSKAENAKLPTVPMAHGCHMSWHAGEEFVIERLIERAPVWWKEHGQWERAEPYFERYLSRREYRLQIGLLRNPEVPDEYAGST